MFPAHGSSNPFSSSKFHLLNQIFNLKNVFFHGGIINFSFKLVNSFLRKNIRNNNITVILVPFHFDWITNKSSHRFSATRTAFQQKVKLKMLLYIFFAKFQEMLLWESVIKKGAYSVQNFSEHLIFQNRFLFAFIFLCFLMTLTKLILAFLIVMICRLESFVLI